MTDDDRTVDADASSMDELRRLAAAARASAQPVADDRTVQADDSSVDELRRFAEQAKRQAHDTSEPLPPPTVEADRTVGADSATLDELRRYAREIAATQPQGPPSVEVETPPPPGRVSEQADVTTLPDLPAAASGHEWSSPPFETPERTSARTDHSGIVGPHNHKVADGWRPPARMVMPVEPEKRLEVHHGPWRSIAIGLGVAVAALVSYVAVSTFTGGDDEAPTDGSVPTTVADTGGEGGSGG